MFTYFKDIPFLETHHTVSVAFFIETENPVTFQALYIVLLRSSSI